jgi:hypothetical protein
LTILDLMNDRVVGESHVLACGSFKRHHLASCQQIAWGVGIVSLLVVSAPSSTSFLESLVLLGYIVPSLLMCLSPGDDMTPDEGIMAHPIG